MSDSFFRRVVFNVFPKNSQYTKKAARISLRFFWLCRATLFCFDWCFFTIMTFLFL